MVCGGTMEAMEPLFDTRYSGHFREVVEPQYWARMTALGVLTFPSPGLPHPTPAEIEAAAGLTDRWVYRVREGYTWAQMGKLLRVLSVLGVGLVEMKESIAAASPLCLDESDPAAWRLAMLESGHLLALRERAPKSLRRKKDQGLPQLLAFLRAAFSESEKNLFQAQVECGWREEPGSYTRDMLTLGPSGDPYKPLTLARYLQLLQVLGMSPLHAAFIASRPEREWSLLLARWRMGQDVTTSPIPAYGGLRMSG